MNKLCLYCHLPFLITPADLKFYDQVSPVFAGKKYLIPEPTLCPSCRLQRRFAWRNERNLYWRTCDMTGKKILSVFSPDKPFKVYETEAWYSDSWNPLEYGRDFNFSRPFFEQFAELMRAVPQLARSVTNNQNCEYINQAGWNKNCYLIFEADYAEDCMYSNYICESKSCLDCLQVLKCELCYECVDCRNCYGLKYSQDSENCSDSFFLKNCTGCQECFGCVNLRNKRYWYFNEPLSKEEYQEKVAATDLSTPHHVRAMAEKFEQFAKTFPQKYLHGTQNEDSTGDYLWNTQRCQECFDLHDAQDCKWTTNCRNVKQVYDMTVFGAAKGVEYCYEAHELGNGVRNVCFSDQSWNGTYNILYSKLCADSAHDLFGCVGLRHKSYCVLNKQYTKDEYEILVPKIIEHMKVTPLSGREGGQGGEYGNFFPPSLSPFGYNETIAQSYYPLTKEEALKRGFHWSNYEAPIQTAEKTIQASQLANKTIDQIPDDILNWTLICEKSKKPFRLTSKELNFYRKHHLPVPLQHHDVRHEERVSKRNPRKLSSRPCSSCQKILLSSYDPDTSEKILCETCFQQVTV